VWLEKRSACRSFVGVVGYRYEEESSSLGKILCICVEWYAYINTFECTATGIIYHAFGYGLVVSSQD